MLSNVTHSRFNPECNTERGCIDQLYIELGLWTLENVLINASVVIWENPYFKLKKCPKTSHKLQLGVTFVWNSAYKKVHTASNSF